MAEFSAGEVIEIAAARNLVEGAAVTALKRSISTDTRTLEHGQWYLALSGEIHDGHKFVPNAIARGAGGCIVSRTEDEWLKAAKAAGCAILQVDNTLSSYQELATSWRRKINPVVIGITGSSGKTTTKEMVAAAVRLGLRYHKSQANENNEIGVPKTILSMPSDSQVLIVEMAMRGLGQIAELAKTALPDVGIITCAGTAHIELLGSVENIVKAKCELLEYLDPQKGLAIIGAPTDLLRKRIKEIYSGKTVFCEPGSVEETAVLPQVTKFKIRGCDVEFKIRAHGAYHMQDVWCAIVAAHQAGVAYEEIAEGLKNYAPVEGRGTRLELKSGAVVVDESYNANPESVRCAVEALLDSRAFPFDKKYVILGEMAELGETAEAAHYDLGKWLSGQAVTMLVTVGEKAAVIADGARGAAFTIKACRDQKEAEEVVRRELSKDACVMVKGSHCANLDKLVESLVASEQAVS